MKTVKIFALIAIVITISISIGWVLINNNINNKRNDILEIERQRFIGRWTSSDGDGEYYFFPDGTLTVNETTYHFGMGVSSKGYIIYSGTWEIVEISDTNGSSHFEFYTNYTLIEKHGMGEGMIFGSAIIPNQFPYAFKELNGSLSVYFILPGLFGSNYTVKLEKISNTIKIQVLVVFKYLNNESYWEWNNESYIIVIHEDEYFGVPDDSIIVSNKTYCNVSTGKQMFKVIRIINESNALIEFNQSVFYNYTLHIDGSHYNPARDPSWDIITIFIENPLNLSTQERVLYPIRGNIPYLDWFGEPNYNVKVYLKIIDEAEKEEDERLIKNLILESISNFENTDEANVTFTNINISENTADVDILIVWGPMRCVGYQYKLIYSDKSWEIESKKRTIIC